MKPILLLSALAAALAATAQETPKTPDTPKTQEAVSPPKAKKAPACSDLPPDQQIRFRLPPALEQEMAKKRAEIARKLGIVLPPPPPPKVLPPCPPQAKPAPANPANPSPESKNQ